MRNFLANSVDLARAAADELIHHLTSGAIVTDEPARQLCLAGASEHDAHDGLLLCRRHFERLGQLLREVEQEAAHLEITPSMSVSYQPSSGGLASQQAPVRLDPLVLADRRHGTGTTRYDFDEHGWDPTPSVLETLTAWARQTRDDRVLAWPVRTVVDRIPGAPPGPTCPQPCGHDTCQAIAWHRTIPIPPSISSERQLLTRHLDWIARQPWVADMYDDLDALARTLKRANDTLDVPAGVCTDIDRGAECGGDVWHVLIRPDGKTARGGRETPGPDDEPGFRCSKCRRVWTGTEAVRKRDRMWRDEQARKAGSGS